MIGPRTQTRERPHRITLQSPGPPMANGDGGFTNTWADLVPPSMDAKIEPASQGALERLGANTVTSMASHLVSIPFHPQVTTQCRVLHNGRFLAITSVVNLHEANTDLVLVCAETVV